MAAAQTAPSSGTLESVVGIGQEAAWLAAGYTTRVDSPVNGTAAIPSMLTKYINY